MSKNLPRSACVAFVFSIPLDVWTAGEFGSLSTVFGVVLLFVGTVAIAKRGRFRRLAVPQQVIIAFVALSWFSLLWSIDADATTQRATTYAQLCVSVLLMWQFIRDAEGAEALLAAYVGGAAIAAIATVGLALRGEAQVDEVRYAASGFDPNDLGVTLAIAIPMAWHLVRSWRGSWRFLPLTYLPLGVLGVVLSASRGAALTTVVALAVVPLGIRNMSRRWRMGIIAVLAVGTVVGTRLVPADTWARLLTIQEQMQGGTMTHRTDIWSAGLSVFAQQWLLGVGAGAFATAVEPLLLWRITAHNTFLLIATELGVVGLALFVAPWIWIIARARKIQGPWRVTLLVLVATWMTGVSSLSWDYRKTTWYLLALSLSVTATSTEAMVRMARRRSSDASLVAE